MDLKAVFFDRDGVVNKDFGYVYKQEDFIFLEGIFEVLEFFKKRGYLLILVTNQSGIGMGYYTIEDFKELSQYMQKEIKKRLRFNFDGIYFCPHTAQEECLCRKPNPGMIQKAIKDFKINVSESILIGDRVRDIEAAHHAGIKYKILLQNAVYQEDIKTLTKENIEYCFQAKYLKEIVNIISNEV
ncbi:D-glycero-alpha-D-manno-heptose-1,7-bisphosphate 7-phosphatase [Helicobacter anatolicus]|uniref:D-glycero-alpha-D-manno-heptose-1,7-bisphosphate 7-phosphatase n=1 Tax=Helicobacter anatolicus TaxID=2905874 RepID=UPI003A10207C